MTKMVSKSSIKKLDPCADRFDNYVEHYGDKKFTVSSFLRLKNITHQDKLWVAFRSMPKKNLSKAAGEIAKSVLSVYEKAYPNDNRPRLAVEAAIKGRKDAAAYAAANAAYAAANAAAYAANAYADAAYAAANAANAAANAAYADAYADAAAYAAAYAAESRKSQEAFQLKIVLKYWK